MRLIVSGLCAAALTLATTTAAMAQDANGYTYKVDGYYLTKEQGAELIAADGRLTDGVKAYQARDFRTARTLCRSALATFNDLDIPDRGVFAPQYDLMHACIGESEYYLGNKRDGCVMLRWIGFSTLHLADARTACAEFVPPELAVDNAITDQHNAYAGAFKTFAGDMSRMSAMSPGSARVAAATALEPHCARLDGFSKGFPAAGAAAGYCLGVVRSEQGNIRAACQAWKEGYADAQNALTDASQYEASGEQKAHARELAENLSYFPEYCADEGYAW